MFDSALTFGVLGPLAVWDDGTSVALGGTKQRILLASLLLSGERPVTSGRLVDALWGERPPRSAAANLHTYVSNLRAVLPPGSDGDRIRRAGGGYALAVGDGELDLRACERLMREAAGARPPVISTARPPGWNASTGCGGASRSTGFPRRPTGSRSWPGSGSCG